MINNNQLTVPCVGSVKQGDSVMIITRNGEPVAVAPIGWGDAIEADISDAAQVAAEAQAVAEATGQHFFTDASGVHVTEAEGDATTDHNILINSLGIMLRKATNYLVSITSSAIAFYDGLGTAASNITAQFGATLARIGYAAGNHVDITDSGVSFSMPYDDGNGHTGTVSAEMYPEYGAYTTRAGVTFSRPAFHIVNDTTDLTLFTGGVARLSDDLQASNVEATGGVYAIDEVVVGNIRSLGSRVTITDSLIKVGDYSASVSIGNGAVSCDTVSTGAINGLYARATGTASAANYFTLINPETNVGVQLLFNPSTRNLAARYTTNGGGSWSGTKTLASWS